MSAQEFKPNDAATGHRVAAFIRAGDKGDPGSCSAAYDPVTRTLRVRRTDGREEILEDLTPSDIDDIEEIMAGGAPPIPEYNVSTVFAGTQREHYGLTALLYLLIEAQGTARLEELVSMIERRRAQHVHSGLDGIDLTERYYRFNDPDLGKVAEKFAVRLLAARLPEVEVKSKPVEAKPKPQTSCICGAEFGAGHEPDCPAAPENRIVPPATGGYYSPPSEVAP